MNKIGAFIGAGCGLFLLSAARAQVVYSSNFAGETSGFTAGGVISSLTTVTLPTDSGGLNSVNNAVWLGRIGAGVNKDPASQEIANLNVTGLTAGRQYRVAFDLFIGGSWDGALATAPYAPDIWSFSVNATTLVNTTFSNVQQGVDAGADSRQNYSPTTYNGISANDPLFLRFTGAAASFYDPGANYLLDYSIYYFGRGAGNPVLTFTATGTSAALQFVRSSGSTDSADEYWALNNVQVSGITAAPEPGPVALMAVGLLLPIALYARCRRT